MIAIATHAATAARFDAGVLAYTQHRPQRQPALAAKSAALPQHSASLDLGRQRAELVNWIVLRGVEATGTTGVSDAILLLLVQAMFPGASLLDIQSAHDCLYVEGLIAEEWHGGERITYLTAAGRGAMDYSRPVFAGAWSR